MDLTIILFLCILAFGFFLFSREIFPLEVSALFIMVLLVAIGIVEQSEAFESFGNQSIVLIGSLFILIAGLRKTGVIARLEQIFLRISGSSKSLSFILLVVVVAGVSAFVSNTATLAVTIPIVVSIAKKFGDSPKKWLMPIAFASVLGGMNSLIGTSTNIIISSLLPEFGLEGFELFTTAKVGLPILGIGLVYLLIARNFLLPGGDTPLLSDVELKYDLRSYSAEVLVLPESSLCDGALSESKLFKEVDITVLGITREGRSLFPRGSFIVRSGDRLLVEGNLEKLTEIISRFGLKFLEEVEPEVDENQGKPKKKLGKKLEFHELLVTAGSQFKGRTPAELALRNRYKLSLVAINRQGVTMRDQLSQVRLDTGDILLVQFIDQIDNEELDKLGLVPLQKLEHERFDRKSAVFATLLFVAALAIGSLTSLPLALTCLGGSLLLIMSGILRMDEVYQVLEWRVLLFIGAILSLGKGMASSGADQYLAGKLSDFFVGMDPIYALIFFFILTIVMTSLLSNQATAVVMIPVAISTAGALGLSPMPFVMAVTIGASCCFVTPFEPAFMLVYGPGEYKFSDFFRLGILLNIVAAAVAIAIIPLYWGFVPLP